LRVFSAFCLRPLHCYDAKEKEKFVKMKLQLLVIFLLFGQLLADQEQEHRFEITKKVILIDQKNILFHIFLTVE
jgi:hypothetical protein